MKIRKKLFIFYIIPLLVLISVSFVYAYLTYQKISEGEELISCAFKEILHLYCPGCGGSRALVALLGFDIVGSFMLYPPLLITVVILAFLYAGVLLSMIKNDEKYVKGFKINSLILIPIAIISFFFLRNILLIFFGIDLVGDFSAR